MTYFNLYFGGNTGRPSSNSGSEKLKDKYNKAVLYRDRAESALNRTRERLFGEESYGFRKSQSQSIFRERDGLTAQRKFEYWDNKVRSLERKMNEANTPKVTNPTNTSSQPLNWQKGGEGYYTSNGYDIEKSSDGYKLYSGSLFGGTAREIGTYKTLKAAKEAAEKKRKKK